MSTTTANSQQQERWFVSAALKALAERKFGKGKTFRTADLRAWVPTLTERRCRYVTTELLRHQFVEVHAGTQGHYTVTEFGAAAIKGAAAGTLLACGQRERLAAAPSTFGARLWALLRARQMLDSATAAETLVDAGGNVAKAQKLAGLYLRTWETAGYLKPSTQRAGRCKRYVLINDPGPATPSVH